MVSRSHVMRTSNRLVIGCNCISKEAEYVRAYLQGLSNVIRACLGQAPMGERNTVGTGRDAMAESWEECEDMDRYRLVRQGSRKGSAFRRVVVPIGAAICAAILLYVSWRMSK